MNPGTVHVHRQIFTDSMQPQRNSRPRVDKSQHQQRRRWSGHKAWRASSPAKHCPSKLVVGRQSHAGQQRHAQSGQPNRKEPSRYRVHLQVILRACTSRSGNPQASCHRPPSALNLVWRAASRAGSAFSCVDDDLQRCRQIAGRGCARQWGRWRRRRAALWLGAADGSTRAQLSCMMALRNGCVLDAP
jgi:hypothetical protein